MSLKHQSPPFRGLPFLVAVASGDAPGWRTVRRFGRNQLIGSVKEDIWPPGGVRVDPTSAATLSVSSTDVNDTLLGSGAQQLHIHGLDASLTEIDEILDMDGTTPVVTDLSYLRVNHVDVSAAGASGVNEGAIDITHSGNTLYYIALGEGHSRLTHYTVPAGMLAWVMSVQSWQGKDETADTAMWHRHADSGVWHLDFHALNYRLQTTVEAHMMAKYRGGGYEGGVDLKMTSRKGGAGADIDVAARYVLLIKER